MYDYQEAQIHIPMQILVSTEERKSSNGLKLPRRIRLNIRQSFLSVRVVEIQKDLQGMLQNLFKMIISRSKLENHQAGAV